MGGSGSHVRAQEETNRARIQADAQVRSQQLANERQLNTETHTRQMQEAELHAAHRRAEGEHAHAQELQKIANQRQAQENAQVLNLKKHELDVKKADDDHIVKIEELNVQREQIKSTHAIEMAKVDEQRDATRMMGDVVKALLDKNMSPTEFAYNAVTIEGVVRNRGVDTQTLNTIAQHHRMLEEAKLAALGAGSYVPSARQEALAFPEDEDEVIVSTSTVEPA